METLNYSLLKKTGYPGYYLEAAPEKVMQFGEGNFLRAFVDYWFDIANEKSHWNGKCVIIKPRKSSSPTCRQLNAQDGLYTLHLRGMEQGEKIDTRRVISSVSRCIDPHTAEGFCSMMALAASDDLQYVVSNTTEAGIVYDPACQLADKPAVSFPGKLTQVLYHRFCAGKAGLVILPCELNDGNGDLLKACVLRYAEQWQLGDRFVTYLGQECLFCNTLVDRIVPGGIRDPKLQEQLDAPDGYHDPLRVVSEVFGIWNIEGPVWLRDTLPFHSDDCHCTVVEDVTPYKKRKVSILNGAHTGVVLGAYLAGFDIVRECMYDTTIRSFLRKLLYEEVIPTLPLERQDLIHFANAVEDRFCNPFVDHALLSISLNSTSKWRTRNLPTLLEYAVKGNLPKCLAMSFAAYIAFYTCNIQALTDKGLICRRPQGDDYLCSDDRWILEFYWQHRGDCIEDLVRAVMTNEKMWGRNLTAIDGFESLTTANLTYIREKGTLAAYASCL